MKIKSVFIFMAVIIFAACSKDALDITFSADYKTDLDVAVSGAKAETYNFESRDTIDPLADEQAARYIDRIKKWNVEGIKGEFKDLSENFKLLNALISIESGSYSVEFNFKNLSVEEAYEIVLENKNGEFDIINKILESKKPFVIIFSGTTDKKDITFKLGLDMKTKVTASPLD